MALNFRARQSSLKTKEGENLWYPALVKDSGTTSAQEIAKKIAEKSSLTRGDVYNVIDALIGEMNDKLMNGHSVRLDGLGSFTAVAKSGGKGVKTPQQVNSSQIKSLRIQFTPSCIRTPMQGTTRALFDGVQFQRWVGDPYHPKNQTSEGSSPDEGGGNDDPIVDPNA